MSTASSGGSPWVSDQFTGNTHSGWSAHAAPTGRLATYRHSHCPQHRPGGPPRTTSKAVRIRLLLQTTRFDRRSDRAAPSGPMHSTPTALPPTSRIRRHPRVGQQREVGAVQRGLQVRAAGAHPGTAVDVERHRTDAGRQRLLGVGAVEIVDPPVARFADRIARKPLCNRRIRRHDGRESARPTRARGLSKSRSVSIARKCGNTSSHAQPGSPQPSKSPGRPRQKYPPLTAPEPPTTAPRMICACRLGSSVNVVG